MPFIYRLHYALALDGVGILVFGVVSLLWTVDCFIGAWLTLPARRAGAWRSWWTRWWSSWKLRGGSSYKLSFNLHRAGGLWTWVLLFM
ncbi:PepSY-associated TM helix domain-containing protein, partial [Acinetobacter baumannii]|uniref:PepSY-associated TM helix domain-containing protein n=1 Tax=Acinetobacter baumannii TaxID=470 RepID=UPI00289780F2